MRVDSAAVVRFQLRRELDANLIRLESSRRLRSVLERDCCPGNVVDRLFARDEQAAACGALGSIIALGGLASAW